MNAAAKKQPRRAPQPKRAPEPKRASQLIALRMMDNGADPQLVAEYLEAETRLAVLSSLTPEKRLDHPSYTKFRAAARKDV